MGEVGAGEVVGYAHQVEEVEAESGQNPTLVGDQLIEDHVVCGDAVRGDEEEVIRVHLIYLADLA